MRGVVVAEAGRIGTPPLLVIGDATGGLPVRLRDGDPVPTRGALVEATGVIAAPFGQTELRLRTPLVIAGTGEVPAPLVISVAAAGEGTEGRLVRTSGTISVAPTKATSGDIVLTIAGSGGVTLRVYADASAGIATTGLRKDTSVTLTGVLGQRASRKGALDGYRLWLRDQADVSVAPDSSPTPGTTATPTPGTTATPTPGTTATPTPGTTATPTPGTTATPTPGTTAPRRLARRLPRRPGPATRRRCRSRWRSAATGPR